MASVRLLIDDMANRITVSTMLAGAGHDVHAEDGFDVTVTDDVAQAVPLAADGPVIVLAPAASIPDAVGAMREGVYGYVYVPIQPGEIEIAVRRAAEGDADKEPPLMTMEEAEEQVILRTLRHCRNNQAKAARILGIGRNTLWRKLKRIKSKGGSTPETHEGP